MFEDKMQLPQALHFVNDSIFFYNSPTHSITSISYDMPDLQLLEQMMDGLVGSGIINLNASMKKIVQHADSTSTTLEHKIVFLVLKYYELVDEEKGQGNWIVDWLKIATKLFRKSTQPRQILNYVLNGDLENLMNELKIIKQTLEEEKKPYPQLTERVDFLIVIVDVIQQLVFQKIVTPNALLKDRQPSPIPPKSHKELIQQLKISTSILLGNEKTMITASDSTYQYCLLQLLYGSVESVADVFENSDLNQIRSKDKANQLAQKYLLSLINDTNYHQTYQLSLSILSPLFAYLLGSFGFAFTKSATELKFKEPQYFSRVLLNMLYEGSKVSANIFFGMAKIYEELQNYTKPFYEQIQTMMFNFLPYHIIDNQDDLDSIKSHFLYMMQINLSQSYLRKYISNLLSLHLNEPLSIFTLEVIALDLTLYYPEQLQYFRFTYFEEGYLLDSNLQVPIQSDILDKVQALVGYQTQIKNQKVCEGFLAHFKDFHQVEKVKEINDLGQQMLQLSKLMDVKVFQAKGEILRLGKKILMNCDDLEFQERIAIKKDIIEFRDNLKIYIAELERSNLMSPQLDILKQLLY